jgi:two-component sensor histidine kinase
VSVGLIVNELVTNAFKYAFPDDRGGTVLVAAARMGDQIEISVTDDGIGCPHDPKQGLGSRLVRLLAAQMKGSMSRPPVERGCRVCVTLPL